MFSFSLASEKAPNAAPPAPSALIWPEPAVLLFDEPLSNLDARLRRTVVPRSERIGSARGRAGERQRAQKQEAGREACRRADHHGVAHSA